ncbi:MAG TPA: beta-ketoacyl synthase N-terminal-like domain-containing protein [Fibrobacteria bacterium]|nr:beta-ketoacyl synthase N-terminal-like domain-containing protein [Fibrobacteria bacterium]
MIRRMENLAITGWGVTSSLGIGVEAFGRGLSGNLPGLRDVSGFAGAHPMPQACVIPDFDINTILGSKGTRTMDRTTGMAVATAGMVLKHRPLEGEAEQTRAGFVLGTTTGSIKSISDFTRETWVQDRPYLVNPALFPNTVMNCSAGQCAIWYKMKGVNATISGGLFSGLLAIQYASLIIRRGYADILVTGSVEEYCEQSAWAYYHTVPAGLRSRHPLGEGCAMFSLERAGAQLPPGRTRFAEILGCRVGLHFDPTEKDFRKNAKDASECIGAVLADAGVDPSEIFAVCRCQGESRSLNRLEDAAVALALEGRAPAHDFSVTELTGNTYSASGSMQLAALLALHARKREGRGRPSLVTAVGHDGTVGCLLIKAGGE